jgi:hypothetical protein
VPIAPEEYLMEVGLRLYRKQAEDRAETTAVRLVARGSGLYGNPGANPRAD